MGRSVAKATRGQLYGDYYACKVYYLCMQFILLAMRDMHFYSISVYTPGEWQPYWNADITLHANLYHLIFSSNQISVVTVVFVKIKISFILHGCLPFSVNFLDNIFLANIYKRFLM